MEHSNYEIHQYSILSYLYDISAGGSAVHVLVIVGDLDAVDDAFELTKVAVCGSDLPSLNIQLPYSQRKAKYCNNDNN